MLIVLGLDSLDANRVQEHPMPTLADFPEQGRLATPENLAPDELFTGYLWASMLAGDHPRTLFPEHFGSDSEDAALNTWNVPVASQGLVKRVEGLLVNNLSRKSKDRLKAALSRVNIEQEKEAKQVLESAGSILDTAESPRLISVPGINGDDSNTELKRLVEGSTGRKRTSVDAETFEREAAKADIDRLVRTINAVSSRKHDFLLAHFFSLDLIQHIWVTSDHKMRRWHLFYDNIIRQVVYEAAPSDTVVIVSDHGMQTSGIHSTRGFYAANKAIWGSEPYRAMDLRDVLEQELTNSHHAPEEGGSEEVFEVNEQTEEHLKNLGYF